MSTVARRPNRMSDLLRWLEDSGVPVRAGLGLAPDLRIEDYIDDSTYVLRAEIPGVDPDRELEVVVEGDVLVVKGERRDEKRDKRHQELHYGAFTRSVRLPVGVYVDQVTATYKDGVLEVRVPFDAAVSSASKRSIPVERQDR